MLAERLVAVHVTMSPIAGRYQILNVQWENLAILPDGNERSQLVGYIQDLEDGEHGDVVRI